MRIGAKKKPFYRVVVVDERAKRTGAYIELLGTYNPLTEPKDIKLKQDRIDYWIKQGAQLSTGYLRIIGKAPQRLPRKPKKQSKQATGDSGQVKTEEPAKTAETAITEEATPVEEPIETAKSEPAEVISETGNAPKEEVPQQPESQPEVSESVQEKESEKKDEGSA